jgi:hypothetical protein
MFNRREQNKVCELPFAGERGRRTQQKGHGCIENANRTGFFSVKQRCHSSNRPTTQRFLGNRLWEVIEIAQYAMTTVFPLGGVP